MVDTIKILDPVQGLIDYVNDIKPYHTKVIESLVEYVGVEAVDIRVGERFALNVGLVFGIDNPLCEIYIVPLTAQTVIDTKVQTVSNVKFTGSPPERVYDFTGTVVYLNGVLQQEITTNTPTGDYSVSGNNQLTFIEELTQGDELDICTGTQEGTNLIGCDDSGYGALPFGDPSDTLVLSPDPAQTVADYPAIQSNNFIVLGDQKLVFDSLNNLTLRLTSFIEERIVAVSTSTIGSPVTGGSFTVLGDSEALYLLNPIFTVKGAAIPDTTYIVTSITTIGSPVISTTINVEGQTVAADYINAFISTIDPVNTGEFSVTGSIFTEVSAPLIPFTTVFITGLTLTPPIINNTNQRYVAKVTTTGLKYKKILSYSNVLKYYEQGSPSLLTQTPDEGVVYAPITELSQTSPTYFITEGEFSGSNIFVGDSFDVVSSTDNNATYIITSITHIPEDLVGSPPQPVRTQFGVASIHDINPDGFIKLDIPSNVFIVDGDYTDFFKQGTRLSSITGSISGDFNVLYSKFINNETRIRVLESLLTCRGPLIYATTPTSFIIDGNHTATYRPGTLFNVDRSLRNNGLYSIISSTYGGSPHSTTITVNEPFDDTDTTGEIHEFSMGEIRYRNTGFGQTPPLCEVVPETIVAVNIKDTLRIDNSGVWARDDIIAYGINSDAWGYDLPPTTVFTTGGTIAAGPAVTKSSTPPSLIDGTIWFDTSLNLGSPYTAPGTLKVYQSIAGSPPATGWVEAPNNKTYWVDTDTNYMYYRMVYQYYDPSIGSPNGYANIIDTGWILEYTNIPGFNEQIPAKSPRELKGFETFFATESSTSVAATTFSFSGSPLLTIPLVGSPATPNPLMLEVTVNSTTAIVTILSSSSFDITKPRLRVGDFIEARVFDDTGLSGKWPGTNTFVGSFDAATSIDETFDMLLGYKFHIDGTDALNNTIHIPDNAYLTGSPPTTNYPVFDIFNNSWSGSPSDNKIEIVGTDGSPNNNGIYTITNVSLHTSPSIHAVLTVFEPLLDTGVFAGSPAVIAGKVLYQQWFQYVIVNTTINTIVVNGDAIQELSSGVLSIKIIHSNELGSPTINNNGTYTINGTPVFDGRNTTITINESLSNVGNTGGWLESI